MADHTKSLSDNLVMVGFGFPTYWDAATWDADTWDITLGTANDIGKNISDTETMTENNGKEVNKYWADSQTSSTDLDSVTLQDGEGWFYEFADHTTNAVNRDPVTWTASSPVSTTWAASSTTATTWGVST